MRFVSCLSEALIKGNGPPCRPLEEGLESHLQRSPTKGDGHGRQLCRPLEDGLVVQQDDAAVGRYAHEHART